MENVQELIQYIEDNLFIFNTNIIYKIKDICFKNYDYTPRFNEVNIVIDEWKHKTNNTILKLDIVRHFLTEELEELISDIQNKYLLEAQHYETNDENHENLQKKIKKIAEICIKLRKSNIFKVFINNYRNGYFN